MPSSWTSSSRQTSSSLRARRLIVHGHESKLHHLLLRGGVGELLALIPSHRLEGHELLLRSGGQLFAFGILRLEVDGHTLHDVVGVDRPFLLVTHFVRYRPWFLAVRTQVSLNKKGGYYRYHLFEL